MLSSQRSLLIGVALSVAACLSGCADGSSSPLGPDTGSADNRQIAHEKDLAIDRAAGSVVDAATTLGFYQESIDTINRAPTDGLPLPAPAGWESGDVVHAAKGTAGEGRPAAITDAALPKVIEIQAAR